MDIKIGDFVLMATTTSGLWIEVIGIIKSETNDPQYLVQYWVDDDWNTFFLAPETAHRGMIKEVRRLDPAIATIFRTTLQN